MLNPGDCVLVPPNIVYMAIVPDESAKSALAAFVFEINGGLKLIEENGYVFERDYELDIPKVKTKKRKRSKR